MVMLPRRIPAHAGDVRLEGGDPGDPPTGVEKVPVERDRDWKVYQKGGEKASDD
jgi:hypothetical protein